MAKWISNFFLGALAIVLSIFTASRTLDLLAWALPQNQAIYQYLGLVAFEGGMYFWAFYFVSGAKGTPQRSIAILMTAFSIIAVCVSTVADLSLNAGESGKIAPLTSEQQQAVIVFLGVIIALNVAAFLACKLLSIEKMREAAEQSAEDAIHQAGLEAISKLAPHIAQRAAPHLASEWAARTWERILPGIVVSEEPTYSPVGALPPGNSQVTRPLQSPVRPPQQVPPALPLPDRKPGLFSRLGSVFHKPKQEEQVTLSQTGEIPAQPGQQPQGTEATAPASQPQGNQVKPLVYGGYQVIYPPGGQPQGKGARPSVANRRAARRARLHSASKVSSFRGNGDPNQTGTA